MPLFKIQIGSGEVSIECGNDIVNDIISSVFSIIIRPTQFPAKIHYRIMFENDRFFLFRNNRLTHRNRQLTRIIYALEWQIVQDLLTKNKSTLKFHSAALKQNDAGFIFCGAASSGKTSLAILLIHYNWELLSDEFAIVDLNQQIIPFPRNLIIKPHLCNKIKIPLDSPIFNLDDESNGKIDARYISPSLFGSVYLNPVPLKGLVFLEKSDHNGFNLQPLEHHQAFKLLTQYLLDRNFNVGKWLNFLVSLLDTSAVYRLKISSPMDLSPTESRALIEQLNQIK
ncbi:MAG TPA: hypothetical protein P5268_06900 [Candidatus Marinimicrobia bacterium]|nr:hypothetical protein [Candidatus Neomarinimicrobiota bacterium]HRS51472.1 hypothetical protein [Candidatus Neomarinimicrobiota bacterium]HRU92742.1 hypothetical protein [Candidatus Neomarinimicrobiota bacterium]